MKTAGKKFTYTKKPTKISKFEIFILNPDLLSLFLVGINQQQKSNSAMR
jgi:hypothetical protein